MGERNGPVKVIVTIMIVVGIGLFLMGGAAACAGDTVKCGASEMKPADVCMDRGSASTYEEQRAHQKGRSFLGIAGVVLFVGGVVTSGVAGVVRRQRRSAGSQQDYRP